MNIVNFIFNQVQPQEFPAWLIAVLSVALPFIYETFLSAIRGIAKLIIVYLLTGIIAWSVALIGGYPLEFGTIGIILSFQVFIYQLFIKRR